MNFLEILAKAQNSSLKLRKTSSPTLTLTDAAIVQLAPAMQATAHKVSEPKSQNEFAWCDDMIAWCNDSHDVDIDSISLEL